MKLARWFVVACALASQAADAGDLVVIGSSVASIAEGVAIRPGQALTVPAGEWVSVVYDTGTVRRIEGPASLSAEPAQAGEDRSVLDALLRLFSSTAVQRSTLAVFRGSPTTRPGPWDLDVNQGGRHCVLPSQAPALWRQQDSQPASAVIDAPERATPATTLRWAAGHRRAAWPEVLPLAAAERFRIGFGFGDPGVEVQLVPIPAGLPTNSHIVAWMADNQCEKQALRLLRRLAAATP